MIKTTAMFSAHTIHLFHVVLRDTLIFLIILFAALFVWLKSGIHIDHLSFDHYEANGLYIKLDKKLTLTAKNIVIPKVKKKPSFDTIDEVLDRVKYLLTFFHYIELEKVNFKDNHYKVIYTDNILYISSDDYEIAGNVWRKGSVLIADISLFYIKKEKINMVAKLNYDLHSDKLILEGNYDAYHISGKFKVIKQEHNVDFIFNSDTFSDLKTVIDKIPMPRTVNRWITEKIQAKQYRLYSLSGKGTVYDTRFTPDLDSLKGNAVLQDATIDFKEGLAPVKTEKIVLRYDRNCLFFDMTDPTYLNREINAATVSITNMKKGSIPHLNLDMQFHTRIDDVVQKILKAYKLTIPVIQKKGISDLRVKLGIPLKKMPNGKIDVYVKAHLGKGSFYVEKVKLPVQSGDITYNRHVIRLKDIKLKDKWYEGTLNGKIHTKEKKADLRFYAQKIAAGPGKKKYFVLSGKEIPITLYYGKKLRILLPLFNIKIEQSEGTAKISINDIAKLKPFIRNFSIEFDGGRMDIWTKDFKTYTFKGGLIRKSCFIYSNKVCYTRVPCSGSFGKKGIVFYAFDKRLYYNNEKSLITLRNLNIDLQKFLQSKARIKQGKRQTKKTGKLLIKGTKSNLRYGKYTLVTDSYNAYISFANNTIKAKGKLGSDVVTFVKKGKYISIEALRIHDRMLHPLIHFDGLQKGRYTIKLSGIPDQKMKGEILLEGGMLKSFKAYNKTRNFIRNNPQLSKIEDPGFTAKGFKITEGKILYHIVKEKVIFDSVYIKGGTATIVGKGELNLKTKKLNIRLAIQTVRKLGKIVGSVPVLGYILMGEDNSITFGLKITGSLDNPKIETSAAKEILMLPFDLIKRTLQSPAHILNNKKQKINVPANKAVAAPKNRVAP
ncbi:Putative periplasmic protein [hydrothermal vent metagenome]|uniref:Putative periplasmic protein n=1 Tax=hydrothermal vent metagenome TaxID=652676 RepID=A0A1W1BWQ7_9ZZZZ